MFKNKELKVENQYKIEKQKVMDFFNKPQGVRLFKLTLDSGDKGENVCPLSKYCEVHFAKKHDSDYPNFSVDPCWSFGGNCICPVKKIEGCGECSRKKTKESLC